MSRGYFSLSIVRNRAIISRTSSMFRLIKKLNNLSSFSLKKENKLNERRCTIFECFSPHCGYLNTVIQNRVWQIMLGYDTFDCYCNFAVDKWFVHKMCSCESIFAIPVLLHLINSFLLYRPNEVTVRALKSVLRKMRVTTMGKERRVSGAQWNEWCAISSASHLLFLALQHCTSLL